MVNRKPTENETSTGLNKKNIQPNDNRSHPNNDLDIDSGLNTADHDVNKGDSDLNNDSAVDSSKYSDSPYPPGFKGE